MLSAEYGYGMVSMKEILSWKWNQIFQTYNQLITTGYYTPVNLVILWLQNG